MSTAGYSGTPLTKKLGITAGARVVLRNEPPAYRGLLHPLPDGVSFATDVEPPEAFVHLFTSSRAGLDAQLQALREQLADDGTLWVSWPKKASGVPSDITEDTIRELALPLGFVDVKVCAIDATWSGLKLVVRKSNRRRRVRRLNP